MRRIIVSAAGSALVLVPVVACTSGGAGGVALIQGVTQLRVCGGAAPDDPPPEGWEPCGQPYPQSARVMVSKGGQVVLTVQSGEDGTFRLPVAPGTYQVKASMASVQPIVGTCPPVNVIVTGPPGPSGVELTCTLFAPSPPPGGSL